MAGSQMLYTLLGKESQRIVLARIARTTLVFLLTFMLFSFFSAKAVAQARCAPTPGAAECGRESTDPGSGTRPDGSRHVGNPMDLLSGNKYQRGDDFAAFASPLVYIRHYNSALANQDIGLGYGWRDTYSLRLYKIESGGYRLIQSDGRSLPFNQLANDGISWRTDASHDGVLIDNGTQQWVLPDGRTWSFKGSYPINMHQPDGSSLSLIYNNQRLHSVTDNLGATLQYHYTEGRRDLARYSMDSLGSQPGHLACMQLPNGTGIRYSYDMHSNLVSVKHSDGINWLYRYENEQFPRHLTQASRSVMNREEPWGCEDLEYIAQNESQKNDLALVLEPEISYESGWEYHEDGRVSEWRQGDRVVSVEYDVDDSSTVENDESFYSTIVNDSSRQRSYRYDFLVDGTSVDHSIGEPKVHVKECENCDWERLVVLELENSKSAKRDAAPETLAKPNDHSVFIQRQRLRDELIRMDVEVVENRFGSASYKIPKGLLDDIEALEREETGTPASDVVLALDVLDSTNPISMSTTRHSDHNFFDFLEFIHTIDHPIQPRPHGSCALPTGMTCDQIEEAMIYARLSSCAYEVSACPNNWDIIDPRDLGINPELFDYGAYHAVILYNSSRDEFVVSFEGTNGISPSDWTSNIQNYFNTTSPLHYNQAADAAVALDQALSIRHPSSSLTFTGHSLGGGSASIAALAVGSPAVVFNSAAVGTNALAVNGINDVNAESLIDVINVAGDPVAHFQADGNGPAPGTHYTIGAPMPDPNIPSHYLDTVHLELFQIHRDNCNN